MAKNHVNTIGAVEANALLAKAGLLRDSKSRPGAPLRELLRKGKLPHAYQNGSIWIIPRLTASRSVVKPAVLEQKMNKSQTKSLETLNTDLAREKFKPANIKYLLIAEAPPAALDRFFYYESVKKHDDLFLGVTGVLYPESKAHYIKNGRNPEEKQVILRQFMSDGFYLLDLSELPLSNLVNLRSWVDSLAERVMKVINRETKIILIKANVFDLTYNVLRKHFGIRVINTRMPFPGSGQQKEFVRKFKEAVSIAGFGS